MGAITVVVYHSYPLLYSKYYHDWLYDLTGYSSSGSISLDVFFVISGFLITQSYCRNSSAQVFFKARMLRIFPAYLMSMLIIALLIGPVFTTLPILDYFENLDTWRFFIGIGLFKLQFYLPQVFTQSYHHTNSVNGSVWSLSYEWVMYFFLFLFGQIGLLKPTKLNISLHAIIIVIMVWFDLNPEFTTIKIAGIQSSIIVHLYCLFMVGSWLFLLKDKFKINHTIGIVTCMVWVATFHTIYYPICALLAIPIMVIWIAHLPINFLRKITSTGDYSYGIYIFGFPIQQIIIQITKGNIGIYPMIISSLFLTLLVAILSFHFIEAPFLKRKLTTS